MSDVFVASNGTKVHVTEDGHMELREVPAVPGWLMIDRHVVADLREFFLHERDQELGRWRDPECTGRYVITDEEGRHIVVEEATSRWTPISREGVAEFPDVIPAHETGARYFAAHPEPKPWESAKPGEVWVVRWPGADKDEEGLVVPSNGWPGAWKCVTAARRIWPEVSNAS